MPLDAEEVRLVNLLEHKVRHLLGLHSGLARYLLNEVPDEAVEIRRVVSLHEAKIPDLESTLAGVFESLLARAAPPDAGPNAPPNAPPDAGAERVNVRPA